MRTERGDNAKTKDLTTAKRTVEVGENRPFEQDRWYGNKVWWELKRTEVVEGMKMDHIAQNECKALSHESSEVMN